MQHIQSSGNINCLMAACVQLFCKPGGQGDHAKRVIKEIPSYLVPRPLLTETDVESKLVELINNGYSNIIHYQWTHGYW